MNFSKVIVLTPNGRRVNVKITPNSTVLQILENVCNAHEYSIDSYVLRHHKKILDTSIMFRFAGLPNNCLLEMVETDKKRLESNVILCVQLEDGTRYQEKVEPTQNFKEILQIFFPNNELNYENPVVIYMRTEIYGEKLSSTTLKTLGITSGRAVVRIINRKPEDLKVQANVSKPISDFKKSSDNEKEPRKSNAINSARNITITADTIKAIKEKESVVSDKEQNKEKSNVVKEITKPKYEWDSTAGYSLSPENIETVASESEEYQNLISVAEKECITIGEREAVIFSVKSAQNLYDDVDDSFFDLTVHDLRLLLRDLQQQITQNEDAPLLTSKQREIERSNKILHKLAHYKKCIVRIQFPNLQVLQGAFAPTEKVETVYDFIRNYLINSNLEFDLFTTPPKKILDLTQTLIESDCVPTVLLHFGAKTQIDSDNILKPELSTKQSTIRGALYAIHKARVFSKPLIEHMEVDENFAFPSTSGTPQEPRDRKSSSSDSNESFVPKWFKPMNK